MSKEALAGAARAKPHISEKDLAALRADLGRLNDVAPGLGDRVVAYVADGEGGGVVQELALHCGPVTELFRNTRSSDPGLRRKSLLERDAWDTALIYRFGSVLAAVYPQAPARYRMQGDDQAPSWLRRVCDEADDAIANRDKREVLLKPFWSAATLMELVEAGGESAAALVCLLYAPRYWRRNSYAHSICDLKEFLAGNIAAVGEAAAVMCVDAREQLAQDIGRLGLAEPYLDLLFRWAVGSSKVVRGVAQSVLTVISSGVLAARASEALAKGKTDERRLTVDLIAALASEQARPILSAHLEAEKSKPVRDAITGTLARLAASPVAGGTDGDVGRMRAIDGSLIDIPPVPPLPADTPLPLEALAEIISLIAPFNAAAAGQFRVRLIDEENGVDNFLALVNGQGGERGGAIDLMINRWAIHDMKWDPAPFKRLFASPDFTLWHLLRLIRADEYGFRTLLQYLDAADLPQRTLRAKLEEGLDFRMAAQMRAALGGEKGDSVDATAREALREAYCSKQYVDLECPSLGLYFLEHLELFEEALGLRPQSGERPLSEMAALRALARLPKIPERLLHPLLNLALGPRKTLRGPAQALLASALGIDDAIVARLSDARKDIRAAAAEWIGRRGVTQAARRQDGQGVDARRDAARAPDRGLG
jgi:hypothetical protein